MVHWLRLLDDRIERDERYADCPRHIDRLEAQQRHCGLVGFDESRLFNLEHIGDRSFLEQIAKPLFQERATYAAISAMEVVLPPHLEIAHCAQAKKLDKYDAMVNAPKQAKTGATAMRELLRPKFAEISPHLERMDGVVETCTEPGYDDDP